VTVYLGLGSNMGPRRRHLRAALEALRLLPTVSALRSSALYEAAHVGSSPQADHLNLCASFECSHQPEELLQLLQAMERAAGRPRDSHGEARTLDLDLLLYGDCVRDDPRCTLPHPRMELRRFVLEPLVDLDPDLRLPSRSETVSILLDEPAIAAQRVRRVAEAGWWQEEMAAWTAS
jgi:2-amino-4-hydroxy-6-hydroxymethyldihydropteridine diphosphokinase